MFEGVNTCKCVVDVSSDSKMTLIEKVQSVRASICETNRNINAMFHCLYGEEADEPSNGDARCLDDELTLMTSEAEWMAAKTKILLERVCGA